MRYEEKEAWDQDKGVTAWMLYCEQVEQTTPPTAKEEKELFRRRDAGDESAVSELVERNQRLVLQIVNDYLPTRSDDYLDVVQEGNIGLLEAIRSFNPKKKVRLIAYAESFITGYVVKALYRRHLIPVPPARKDRKANPAIPSLMWINEDPYAAERELNTEEMGEEDALHKLLTAEGKAQFDAAIQALPVLERRVVSLKYGLGLPEPMTAEEVGDVVGLSTRRVKQILTDALRHLRGVIEDQDYDHSRETKHKTARRTAPKPNEADDE